MPNLARPGGNITGSPIFAPELTGKQLELLSEIVPSASRVALLANPPQPVDAVVVRGDARTPPRGAIQLHLIEVHGPADLDAAFETMRRARVDALIVSVDPMFSSQHRRIVELAARRRLPATYRVRLVRGGGGLLSYGQRTCERFRRAAAFVDRILKGAKPGDLPSSNPRSSTWSSTSRPPRRSD